MRYIYFCSNNLHYYNKLKQTNIKTKHTNIPNNINDNKLQPI